MLFSTIFEYIKLFENAGGGEKNIKIKKE